MKNLIIYIVIVGSITFLAYTALQKVGEGSSLPLNQCCNIIDDVPEVV